MFIKATTHNRIVAEKDAQIAGLMKRLNGADHQIDQLENCVLTNTVTLKRATMAITELRARLAPFTTLRARDGKGRFIKDTLA